MTLCPGATALFFFFFFQPRDCESLGLNGPMAFDYHSPSSASVVRCHAVLSCGVVMRYCHAVLSEQIELAYGKGQFISRHVAYLTPRA